MKRRILYIQYTNPAHYPSLEHSSHILAEEGWQVLFLGINSSGPSNNRRFQAHKDIIVRKLPYCAAGWFQKFHYIYFCLWVGLRALLWRPQWVYASDPLSCPIALILSYFPGIKGIYHEHDSPDSQQNEENGISDFMKRVLWARKNLAHRLSLCILPNEQRIKLFTEETGSRNKIFCIWNCPRSEEVKPPKPLQRDEKLSLYYHGVIDKAYLPRSVLEAIKILQPRAHLKIIGYETVGSRGYINYLKKETHRLGIADRVEISGPMPRYQLLQHCQGCDIGLAFIPRKNQNINNRYMAGASNKSFDYLACGLALLISDLPDWKKMYIEPGYGLACDPDNPESIAACLHWFLEHPKQMREMGERGRQRIIEEWNYERQFESVKQKLEMF